MPSAHETTVSDHASRLAVRGLLRRRRTCRRYCADPQRSLCARGAARGAGRETVLRSLAFGIRPDVLRHLPRSAARASVRPTALAVQFGGKDMQQPGCERCRSLKYLQAVPQFTEHYFESDDEGDDSVDNGPTGGLTWDGRVDRGRDQARIPLLSPLRDGKRLRRRRGRAGTRRASYADELRKIFGDDVFDDTGRGLCRHRRGA